MQIPRLNFTTKVMPNGTSVVVLCSDFHDREKPICRTLMVEYPTLAESVEAIGTYITAALAELEKA